VLQAWERGIDRPMAERAACALEILAEPDRPPTTSLFARDAALLRLRIALRGPQADAVVHCPSCDAAFDLAVDLAAFQAPPVVSSDPVTVAAEGYTATVRPPGLDDLHGLERLAPAAFADALFRRCVTHATHRGEAVGPEALPAPVRRAAAEALSERGLECPHADLTCGACGAAWRAPLDIARMVLHDIEAWVGQRLEEVHRIASAYHWSERDILALSPARRRFYLEAIG
jgi:hypothetical protein